MKKAKAKIKADAKDLAVKAIKSSRDRKRAKREKQAKKRYLLLLKKVYQLVLQKQGIC